MIFFDTHFTLHRHHILDIFKILKQTAEIYERSDHPQWHSYGYMPLYFAKVIADTKNFC